MQRILTGDPVVVQTKQTARANRQTMKAVLSSIYIKLKLWLAHNRQLLRATALCEFTSQFQICVMINCRSIDRVEDENASYFQIHLAACSINMSLDIVAVVALCFHRSQQVDMKLIKYLFGMTVFVRNLIYGPYGVSGWYHQALPFEGNTEADVVNCFLTISLPSTMIDCFAKSGCWNVDTLEMTFSFSKDQPPLDSPTADFLSSNRPKKIL